jgi:hypothetical protein
VYNRNKNQTTIVVVVVVMMDEKNEKLRWKDEKGIASFDSSVPTLIDKKSDFTS